MVTMMKSNSMLVIFHFESYFKNLNIDKVCDMTQIIFNYVDFKQSEECSRNEDSN